MKKITIILFLLVLLVSSFIFASCERMMKNAGEQAQEEINSEVETTASPAIKLPRHRKKPTEAVDSLVAIIKAAIKPSDSSAILALDSLTLYGQGTEVLLWLQWEVLQMHIMQSSDYQDSISAIHLQLREVQKALKTGEYEKAQNLLNNVLKM